MLVFIALMNGGWSQHTSQQCTLGTSLLLVVVQLVWYISYQVLRDVDVVYLRKERSYVSE